MTTAFLLPDPVQSTFFIPGGNTPGNGAQVGFFVNLSSTPTTVYKDSAGAVAWPNPIVLDSGGNLPLGGTVWVPSGVTVTVKWAPSNDVFPFTSPYRTIDGLTGIGDSSAGASTSDWVSGPTPTFVSGTSFTVPGDQTLLFTLGRRVKTTNTGGTVYSMVTSVIFGAGITTVRVVNDSLTLDSGISAVFYGLIDPSASSIDFYHVQRKAANVASSPTTDIWGIAGDYAHVTGTNTIFNFSTASYAGAKKTIVFDGSLTLASSSALKLPGNFNITTSANDFITVVADTVSTAILSSYFPASGIPSFQPQGSSTVLAGPISGTTAVPTFRSLVGAESAFTLLDVKSFLNTSVCNFTTNISSSYDFYKLIVVNLIPVTDAQDFWIRSSLDGGVTFNAAGSGYSWAFTKSAAAGNVSSAADSKMVMASGFTNTGGPMHGEFKFNSPGTNGIKKMFTGHVGYQGSGAGAVNVVSSGYLNVSTGPINAIQFLMSAGNVSSATAYLYAMRAS